MANELNKLTRLRVKYIDVIFNDDLTAAPIDPAIFDRRALTGTWSQLGYLDRSQVVEIPRSGGEVTVDDTLNELAVDSEQAPIDRDVTFAVQQTDLGVLKAIYGDDLYDELTDEFELPSQPISKTRQYQVMLETTKGQKRCFRLAGSISTTADLSLDPTKTSAIPVSIKVLSHNGKGIRMVGFGPAPVVP